VQRRPLIVSRDVVWHEEEFPGVWRVAHNTIPKRFGRSAEPGDAENLPDDEEVSDSTDSEGVVIPLPFEPAAPLSDSDPSSSPSSSSSQLSGTASLTPSPPPTPPRTPSPRKEWAALSPQAPHLPTRIAPWPQQQGTVPPSPRTQRQFQGLSPSAQRLPLLRRHQMQLQLACGVLCAQLQVLLPQRTSSTPRHN
jgi:hypothetical protein